MPVGSANGLDGQYVVSCDGIVTIEVADLGARVGVLLERQELALTAAISAAFDLA